MAASGSSKANSPGKLIASPEKSTLGETIESGVTMATIQDDDERLLARIGYKQVYCKRRRSHRLLLTVLFRS